MAAGVHNVSGNGSTDDYYPRHSVTAHPTIRYDDSGVGLSAQHPCAHPGRRNVGRPGPSELTDADIRGEGALRNVKRVKLSGNSLATSSGQSANSQRLERRLQSLSQEAAQALNRHRAWLMRHLADIDAMDVQQLEAFPAFLDRHMKWVSEPDQLDVIKRTAAWAMPAFLSLLDRHQQWATNHLDKFGVMSSSTMHELPAILDRHDAWTHSDIQHFNKMNRRQLDYLRYLLDRHKDWAIEHLHVISAMDSWALNALEPILVRHKAWASVPKHLAIMKTMVSGQLRALAPLLDRHKQWTTAHIEGIRSMDHDQLTGLRGLLDTAPAWTKTYFQSLTEIPGRVLRNLHSFFEIDILSAEKLNESNLKDFAEGKGGDVACFIERIDPEFQRFIHTVNPFVQAAFQTKANPLSLNELKAYGVSRSTLYPAALFDSSLIRKFAENYARIPEATFGVEVELFMPGLTFDQYDDLKHMLGADNYSFKEDDSLYPNSEFDGAVELASPILSSPEDIQKLQNILSILHDMGGSSNNTSGAHIHIGLDKWKADGFSNDRSKRVGDSVLHAWNTPNPLNYGLTPYQLRFIKQFFVNMHSMQEDFYLVSRNSVYSRPNGPTGDDKSIDRFYRDLAEATDVRELIRIGQPNERESNVNLESIDKHYKSGVPGTVEIRGFTKKNSDHMGVDPNIPVRDILFLQEVLIKTREDTDNFVFSTNCHPRFATPALRPSEGLSEIAARYTQDTLTFEIIHALMQWESGKQLETMALILEDREHIHPATTEKIRTRCHSLLAKDELARQFLDALDGVAVWGPPSGTPLSLKRRRSLRSLGSDVI